MKLSRRCCEIVSGLRTFIHQPKGKHDTCKKLSMAASRCIQFNSSRPSTKVERENYYLLRKLPWYIGQRFDNTEKNYCQSIDVNKQLTCCEIDAWVIEKIFFQLDVRNSIKILLFFRINRQIVFQHAERFFFLTRMASWVMSRAWTFSRCFEFKGISHS